LHILSLSFLAWEAFFLIAWVGKLVLGGRFDDIVPSNPYSPDISVYEPNLRLAHLVESANKHPPAVVRLAGMNTDTLAEVTLIVRGAQERAVNPRRRNLQGVTPGHRIMSVKQIAELPMDPSEFFQ
jgi:hypothetical protein